MNDVADGGWWESWNVSKSEGPLGSVCDPSLHQDYPCYTSCGKCGYQVGLSGFHKPMPLAHEIMKYGMATLSPVLYSHGHKNLHTFVCCSWGNIL